MRELEENNIVPFEGRAALHEAAQQRAKLQALAPQLASFSLQARQLSCNASTVDLQVAAGLSRMAEILEMWAAEMEAGKQFL